MVNKLSFEDRILIAGSNGMVGSAIKKVLERSGYGTISGGIIFSPSKSELDLTNSNQVKDWFEVFKPTIVIVAAAKVGGIYANATQPTEFLLQNLKIQLNLIETSWQYKVKRLLFLGSSCIYPKFSKQPIKEEYLLTGSLEKTNESYAIAKISGLKLCESLRNQYNFDSYCLMPTNLYGPKDNYHPQNSHVLPALILKFHQAIQNNLKKVECWGSGNALREFLYVDDLAEACLFTLKNWHPLSNSESQNNKNLPGWLNVGSNYEITIKELATKIAKEMKYEGEIIWDQSKPDGTPRKKLDSSRINNLGWEASTTIENGITKTIKCFKEELSNNVLRSY